MAQVDRRTAIATGATISATAALAACGTLKNPTTAPPTSARPVGSTSSSAPPKARLIGDGSTSDTGPQPHQPTAEKLEPGQAPPQFVVISWDGAGEVAGLNLLSHFREVAKETKASMTLFLSGLFLLPAAKKDLYRPPRHQVGASDIGYLDDRDIHATIDNIGKAWLEGHEIGTHFNGHFCGRGGVSEWSPAEWRSEIEQAKSFVKNWRTNTGFTDLPPLPFDYDKELVGGRTPCLEGADNLRVAASQLGWRYDTSKTGIQMWPGRDRNLWDVSMQSIPFAGHSGQVISMDYNIMYNQSGGTRGKPSMRPKWQQEAVDTYLAGFLRAYDFNRAPLIIGNHFEGWNGGIYMTAVEQVMRKIVDYPDARIVSFRQLIDWVEEQDPAVLAKLRSLPYGSKPTGGWAQFLAV
ncbi:hypothetical protein HJ588_06190 [Flexivirga sp. ID2601S]|uniref:Polysaccharide deacetylase n=1 Tax=Flexivirga aerilata TaxID=1656889 RepID=A0A849AQ04_9MICO|nr:hypothetical protein [Flexivirga aerilata]NNG38862.1 hypothetical protein [Flexivirga aerilata]